MLDPGTPGIPASVPYRRPRGGYDQALCCLVWIDRQDVPGAPKPLHRLAASYYCTRPKHGDDGPHVCHLRNPEKAGQPLICLIVWGGE